MASDERLTYGDSIPHSGKHNPAHHRVSKKKKKKKKERKDRNYWIGTLF